MGKPAWESESPPIAEQIQLLSVAQTCRCSQPNRGLGWQGSKVNLIAVVVE